MALVASPESVLKRSEELTSMHKEDVALELLYEMILSKRTRSAGLESLEPVVLRFVELSVRQRKGKIVKDGLHQYRKLVVATNVSSLGSVIDRLLSLAEEMVANAQQEADQITVDEEDLEAEDSPEDLLMATVSSEHTKDRTDRELVTPWLKFLWESYRSVLDVLRNNSRLEQLYAKVVSQAFQFCLKYQRKTEFRRLCELLRNHIQMAAQQAKTPGVPNPVDLHDPETQQIYLDIRFEQLDAAVKLELWQESFRSVEDVHALLVASSRPLKLANMANYYETLARIFSVANDHLFHAAAWSKFYSMVYHTRHSAPEGELERIASFFVLSVLCIPASYKEEVVGVRSRRLSSLLSLAQVPTRESLKSAAMAKNVLYYVRPEIKQLYGILESDFHPLLLKERLVPVIELIGNIKAYSSYTQPLLRVIIGHFFEQLSRVYTTAKLDNIVDMISLPAPFNLPREQIEHELVLGSQNGAYAVRIDHREGSVTFLDSLSAGEHGSHTNEPTASLLIIEQLRDLARCLHTVLPQVDSQAAEDTRSERQAVVSAAVRGLEDENRAYLARREELRERQDRAKKEREEEEQRIVKERARRQNEELLAEQARREQEAREREIERERKERQAIQLAQRRKMAEEINANGIIKVDLDKLDEIDDKGLRAMQIEQLKRESEDLQTRMDNIYRQVDHLERAHRKEEAALWVQDGKSQESRDRQTYEERKTALIESARKRFDQAVAYRERYSRMSAEFVQFSSEVNERRRTETEERRARNAPLLEKAKAERREKVLAERAAEAERRKSAEAEHAAMAAQRAERERVIAEEREKARAELAGRTPGDGRYMPPSRAKPASDPFGGARPVSTGARASSAAAGASPAATAPASPAPKSSPFGGARPIETRDSNASSPFGSARPTRTGPSTGASQAAPPASNAPARSSPFGSAQPKVTRDSNPFGKAAPTNTGKDAAGTGSGSAAKWRPKSIPRKD